MKDVHYSGSARLRMTHKRLEADCTVFSRRKFDTALIQRALIDHEFRKRLVEDPKSVYSSELGRQIPKEVVIQVLEETGNTIYIVIPHSPMQLTEAEANALASREKTHREPCWNLGDGSE